MKILMAEDDPVSRSFLKASLVKWGYEALVASDGKTAWDLLQSEKDVSIALLDWMMPEIDGVEVCRMLHSVPTPNPVYTIILTAKTQKQDVVTGLEAGADDYLTKPFDREELRARIRVGVRIIELRQTISARVQELETALSQVKQLQGLLPICSYCKKIRDDQNYWQQVDSYISSHSQVAFSHSVCPGCYQTYVKPDIDRIAKMK